MINSLTEQIKQSFTQAFSINNINCTNDEIDKYKIDLYDYITNKFNNLDNIVKNNTDEYNLQKLNDWNTNNLSILYKINHIVLQTISQNNKEIYEKLCDYISSSNLLSLILNLNKLLLSLIYSKIKLVIDSKNEKLEEELNSLKIKIKQLESDTRNNEHDKEQLQKLNIELTNMGIENKRLVDLIKKRQELETSGVNNLVKIIDKTHQVLEENHNVVRKEPIKAAAPIGVNTSKKQNKVVSSIDVNTSKELSNTVPIKQPSQADKSIDVFTSSDLTKYKELTDNKKRTKDENIEFDTLKKKKDKNLKYYNSLDEVTKMDNKQFFTYANPAEKYKQTRFKDKYLKYKNKYLQLKNELFNDQQMSLS